MLKRTLLGLLWLISLNANAVVILQYHHVSETTPASTSVTPAQFEEQMQYLAENEFTIIPLTQAVNALKNNTPLADKSIVITFDDGYDSIGMAAAPILAKYDFPYTVFVSVEPIEKGYRGMMSWDDIKTLTEKGATIANHSWAHEHLNRKLDGESKQQWLDRIEANLLATEAEINKHTGQSVKMLAYPYGEYNSDVEDILKKHAFIGLGQQSGAAGKYSILTALPRFPVAGPYADLDSLKVKFTSLNMPVVKQNITDPQLSQGQWRPELTVELDTTDIYPHQVMCFVQGQGAKKPTWVSETEFNIQASANLPAGRSRYNCTAPSKTKSGYYWFSQAWLRPNNDGSWPTE
ncbi:MULTISPECIES: polysaccharide deacetylase family protein [unclassified Shewanella]|uniref:polysaccharide deacetylase family protein n=1 Tax=unclassified Shewanella TaxID=196818 RepID=UPI000C84B03D|nr:MULTISPECIES: polysaccharide deacetylase family protein [unclassified Shewanella]MDO6620969.1 polysaccharide deacetylase family protein [Shewanella sp. 6_MG-2023]MDO6639633.1 polysaccharide deacetylase family protein [Shewanella sp. 5_MG-2023]MDO6678093.1 polysaccharide deacetylase family protein [Shewanella sp. 4_MG-2023]MDO6774481.1 polysaccharide deacetylase family protein [Shewanella sp. 3_MG-2023]PMG29866.1 polysaccharide deacetylase [Shewanella sp. 10N.286.52.C2]